MKAVLEFSLPEEREEFRVAQDGWKYKAAITDVLNELRSKIKYSDETNIALEAVRGMIYDKLSEYEISE